MKAHFNYKTYQKSKIRSPQTAEVTDERADPFKILASAS